MFKTRNTILMLTVLSACYTSEKHGLQPAVTNPEIALPVLAANEALGLSSEVILKGEILESESCLKPYVFSQLRIKVSPVNKPDKTIHTFSPSSQNFSRRFYVDKKAAYKVKLVYEPKQKTLFERKIRFEGKSLKMRFYIPCRP